MSNEHERPSQPPSQHMVIERRRVSSDGANVQVLELELSDTAREALPTAATSPMNSWPIVSGGFNRRCAQ